MATYTIVTDATQEAALTAFVEQENANAPSLGLAPYANNQAYITAAAQRMLLDPLTSLFVEAFVVKFGEQARRASLEELLAADAALPD